MLAILAPVLLPSKTTQLSNDYNLTPKQDKVLLPSKTTQLSNLK